MSDHLSGLPVPIYNAIKPKPLPLPRPKYQTSRSITESAFPAPKLHRPHRHHRHKEKDPQSAGTLQPNNGGTGLDGSKSEFVTPEESRAPSRRTSLRDVSEEIEGSAISSSWREERRTVKANEVTSEREKGALRAAELRNVLNNLNIRSNNTMMHLDTSYYSVLEKLSILQSTVTSMKDLAHATKELNEDFNAESAEVVTEVETSLSGFQNFDAQQNRIEALAAQVKKGREKIKTFGDRVEIVKVRVDAWESAENEWQERTRKRLKVFWIITGVCVVVLMGLMAFQYTPARTQGPGVMKGLNTSEFGRALPDLEKNFNDNWTLKRGNAEQEGEVEKMKARSQEKEDVSEDPRLRIFDEL